MPRVRVDRRPTGSGPPRLSVGVGVAGPSTGRPSDDKNRRSETNEGPCENRNELTV